jgi:hypothetical protein
MIGWYGYHQGQQLLVSKAAAWKVLVKQDPDTDTRLLVGMRRFEKVIVAVDFHRGIVVLPSDSIVAANLLADATNRLRNSCRWFGIFCHSVNAKSGDT